MYKNLWLPALFLLLSACLCSAMTSLHRLGRSRAKGVFAKGRSLFFFLHLLKPLFPDRLWEGLFFSLAVTKNLFWLCYALTALLFTLPTTWGRLHPISSTLLILAVGLLVQFASLLLSTLYPQALFRLCSGIASLSLTALIPLHWPLFKLLKALAPKEERAVSIATAEQMKAMLIDILDESELSSYLDIHDKRLLLAVASFKNRIAREVMVPRIDLITLPITTTIKEAASLFIKEGYSRIPVYRESVDQIVGVLLHKDVLSSAVLGKNLESSIKVILKPVLYTPETKKLAHLLQEFRSKQSHLAIVVDEYGGTEGIVTIEDILEELVGEIADEYDTEEETLYQALAAGEWIVDAKMSLIDIEEEIGVAIPQSSEYDSLGGYIFHKAGSIPTKGWRLHHDNFDLEVLSSTERSIEKVRITSHIA